MSDNDQARDVAAAGLGVLALALGAATVLGVVRPPDGVMADNLLIRAVVGLVSGLIGLWLARTRGYGRQIAVLGTAVALIGLAVLGGGLALEALVEDVRSP